MNKKILKNTTSAQLSFFETEMRSLPRLSNPELKIEIFALEVTETKFDTIFFGFVRIGLFRTYCFFTKAQINFLSERIKLTNVHKPTIRKINLYKDEMTAKESKFYIDTYFFLISKHNHNQGEKCLLNIFKNHLSNPIYRIVLCDKKEVIYKEPVKVSVDHWTQHIGDISFGYYDLQFLKNFSTYNEFKEYYRLPKDFDTFFNENKLFREDNESPWKINRSFFNAINFVHKAFDSYNFSFHDYKEIILHIANNHRCFFDEFECHKESHYLFKKCFLRFGKENIVTKIKNWTLYHHSFKDVSNCFDQINKKFKVDYKRFKDPTWCFNFYSKKLNETYEDYDLPFGQNDSELNNIILSGKYKIKTIKQNKDLILVGSFLHNCAGGFDTKKYYLKHISFIIYENDPTEPLYLGTINETEKLLSQLKGFKNSSPPLEIFKEIYFKLSDLGIINQYKSFSLEELYKKVCKQRYN